MLSNLKCRKILVWCLVFCLSLNCLPVFAGAAQKKPNYLLLGDSIAAGFGIQNPHQASYGKLVADSDGYNYYNDAQTARDSYEMIEQLRNVKSVRNHIKNADIISISIGANDYLDNDDFVSILIGAMLGINDKMLDEIAEGYYQNLTQIIAIIRELNPNAVILMQNVYCAWSGFAERIFRAGSDRVNQQINRYIEEHPGEVYLCDIAPAMTGHPENLADDSVHPNAKGNVAIAELVLKQLKGMGLGTAEQVTVNVAGIDYTYYELYFADKFSGGDDASPLAAVGKTFGTFITVLMKVITGNSVNLQR